MHHLLSLVEGCLGKVNCTVVKPDTQVRKGRFRDHREASGKEMQLLAGGNWAPMQCSGENWGIRQIRQEMDKLGYKNCLYIFCNRITLSMPLNLVP